MLVFHCGFCDGTTLPYRNSLVRDFLLHRRNLILLGIKCGNYGISLLMNLISRYRVVIFEGGSGSRMANFLSLLNKVGKVLFR